MSSSGSIRFSSAYCDLFFDFIPSKKRLPRCHNPFSNRPESPAQGRLWLERRACILKRVIRFWQRLFFCNCGIIFADHRSSIWRLIFICQSYQIKISIIALAFWQFSLDCSMIDWRKSETQSFQSPSFRMESIRLKYSSDDRHLRGIEYGSSRFPELHAPSIKVFCRWHRTYPERGSGCFGTSFQDNRC